MPLRSIRARMTLVFALSVALLMLLACGALIGYARYAAEREAQTLLQATTLKALSDLAESRQQIDRAELIEDSRPGNMALLVIDPNGQPLFQSQPDVPPRPWKDDADWRVKTAPFHANTIVIGLPWRKT